MNSYCEIIFNTFLLSNIFGSQKEFVSDKKSGINSQSLETNDCKHDVLKWHKVNFLFLSKWCDSGSHPLRCF